MISSKSHSPQRATAGFSLVELMVALLAGTLVVSSVYIVGAGSARYFQHQNRLSHTQMALRTGMEILRKDIARAGFMGSPNSRLENMCAAPAQHIQAVEFINNADLASIPNAAANSVRADRIRLVGNYASSDSYLAASIVGGSAIRLQRNWQGFRRSFVNPTNGRLNRFEFRQVFQTGRMIHLETLQGYHFFSTITGTVPGFSQINISPPLPIGTDCLDIASGATITPLSRIEYLIGDLGGDLNDAGSNVVKGQATQLIRREISFGAAATPVRNSERVVLEYPIDFDLRFVLDAAAAGAQPILVRAQDAPAAIALANINTTPVATPQNVRSVRISISTRTQEQDPRFAFLPPIAGTAPRSFQFDPTRPGAARVRTMSSEVFLPNLAYWRRN